MDSPSEAEDSATRLFGNQAITPLLPLIAQGNLDAVDRFVERYSGLIWTLTKRMTRNSHDAEDLVQEIFVELWKKADQFDVERGSEVAFVSLITKRRVFDRLRKRSLPFQIENLGDTPTVDPFQNTPTPLEIAEEIAKVRNCLSLLKPNTQSVLTLILQDGLSQQEVSISLQMPLGTVKSFARRGLLTLRECVKKPFAAATWEAKHETK